LVAHMQGVTDAEVLQNTVLRKTFLSRKDEVTANCRKLQTDDHNFHSPKLIG